MSINFLISQAKLIQEVIDAHAPEIENSIKKLAMEIIFLMYKEASSLLLN